MMHAVRVEVVRAFRWYRRGDVLTRTEPIVKLLVQRGLVRRIDIESSALEPVAAERTRKTLGKPRRKQTRA